MRRKKHLFIISLLLLGAKASEAQQTPLFSNYYYNQVLINPAHAGYFQETDITLNTQGYLNAFEGSPRTVSGLVTGSVSEDRIGLGAGVISDRIGVSSTTEVFGAYAYKIEFEDNDEGMPWWDYQPSVLSFGISTGLLLFDEGLLELGIAGDPNFKEDMHTVLPSFNFGVLLQHDHLYLGFSARHLFSDSFTADQVNIERPLYLYGAYNIYRGQMKEVRIQPSMLVKLAPGVPAQMDVNITANYKNYFELGGGYRTGSSFNVLLGVYAFDQWRLAYTYHLNSGDSPIGNTNGLTLSYRFGEGFTKTEQRTINYRKLFH